MLVQTPKGVMKMWFVLANLWFMYGNWIVVISLIVFLLFIILVRVMNNWEKSRIYHQEVHFPSGKK